MEMVLLGAGASVEAEVPGAFKMTEAIYARFRREDSAPSRNAALAFVIGGLQFRRAASGGDPFGGVDIEELFNALDLLATRGISEAAPFINAWHPMVDWYDRHYDFDGEIDRLVDHIRGMSSINPYNNQYFDERQVKETFYHLFSPLGMGGESGTFRSIADTMTRHLIGVAFIDNPARVEYLAPLLDLRDRQGRLVIATLNYDNTVEVLAAAHGESIDTGIEGWTENGLFDFGTNGLHLLKLHGSINWRYGTLHEMGSRPFSPSLAILDPLDRATWYTIAGGLEPALLFGRHNKLTADGPFLDMIGALKTELSRCDTLTVVGYSFRDQHINACIAQWLQADDQRHLTIINRSRLPDTIALLRGLRRFPERLDEIVEVASVALRERYARNVGVS